MKAFTISSLVALLAAMAQAAPAPAQIGQPSGIITFQGADPDAYYTQLVPTDGSFTISTSLRHVPVFLVSIVLIDPPLTTASDAREIGLGESR